MSQTTLTIQVTQREAALLNITRRLRNGTIEKLSITNGEPGVVSAMTQRIDLCKSSELDLALGETQVPVPFREEPIDSEAA